MSSMWEWKSSFIPLYFTPFPQMPNVGGLLDFSFTFSCGFVQCLGSYISLSYVAQYIEFWVLFYFLVSILKIKEEVGL